MEQLVVLGYFLVTIFGTLGLVWLSIKINHKGVLLSFLIGVLLCVSLFLLVGFLMVMSSDKAEAATVDVCLLTDMSGDVDDIGALQLALYFHKHNEINLRCVIVGTSNSNAHRPIRHLIEYWGYSTDDILIGNNKNSNGNYGNDSRWVNPYIDRYNVPDFSVKGGADLLNSMIDRHPDMMVIEIGPATTVYNAQAMHRIKKYVQMGAEYRQGNEYNMQQHVAAAQYVTRFNVEWYDETLGNRICTGQASVFPHLTPVSIAYQDYTGGACRPSWDLLAVLGAVRGDEFFTYRQGYYTIDGNGYSRWFDDLNNGQTMAFERNSTVVRDFLNSIMSFRPEDVENLRKKKVDITPILMLLLLDD